MTDLTVAEAAGHGRFGEGIAAGAAAAEVGFGQFDITIARSGANEAAGSLGDALGMREVAGVVAGDAVGAGEVLAEAGKLFRKAGSGGQPLGEIADALSEGVGSAGIIGVAGEEGAVVLEGGTAAGGINDDGVEFGDRERFEVVAGGGAGGIELTAVGMEGAAAGLVGWNEDVVAGGIEEADGLVVGVAEEGMHHAAGEKCDPPKPGGSGGRGHFGKRRCGKGGFERKGEEVQPGTGRGGEERFEVGGAGEPGGEKGDRQASGMGEDAADEDTAEEGLNRVATVDTVEVIAGGFEEVSVGDAAGAGGFAGAAAEAKVEVPDGGAVWGKAPRGEGTHQVDASARGIVFVAGFEIGGAGGEAEAAMDAGGCALRIEEGGRGAGGWGVHSGKGGR